jgi:hypothetical protein
MPTAYGKQSCGLFVCLCSFLCRYAAYWVNSFSKLPLIERQSKSIARTVSQSVSIVREESSPSEPLADRLLLSGRSPWTQNCTAVNCCCDKKEETRQTGCCWLLLWSEAAHWRRLQWVGKRSQLPILWTSVIDKYVWLVSVVFGRLLACSMHTDWLIANRLQNCRVMASRRITWFGGYCEMCNWGKLWNRDVEYSLT